MEVNQEMDEETRAMSCSLADAVWGRWERYAVMTSTERAYAALVLSQRIGYEQYDILQFAYDLNLWWQQRTSVDYRAKLSRAFYPMSSCVSFAQTYRTKKRVRPEEAPGQL
eukprot:4955103-Amphidinium_carterae.1